MPKPPILCDFLLLYVTVCNFFVIFRRRRLLKNVEIVYAAGELFEHFEADFIPLLGLCKVVHICFEHLDIGRAPALELELLEAHRDIFFADSLGGNEGRKLGDIIDISCHERTFEVLELHLSADCGICGVAAVYLNLSYRPVMLAAARTIRLTERIYEYLASFLVVYLFKLVELIVPVIVKDNKAIRLFKLGIYAVHIPYLLAGRGRYLIIGVIFADIAFEHIAHNDDLIQAVVSHFQYLVAVFVGKMLLGEQRVRERKAQGNAKLAEGLDNEFGHSRVEFSADASSAVPCRTLKAAENGRYFKVVDKIFGVVAESFYHQSVKAEMRCKAWEMKTYAHFAESFQVFIIRFIAASA